jgi:hypothetical protein
LSWQQQFKGIPAGQPKIVGVSLFLDLEMTAIAWSAKVSTHHHEPPRGATESNKAHSADNETGLAGGEGSPPAAQAALTQAVVLSGTGSLGQGVPGPEAAIEVQRGVEL